MNLTLLTDPNPMHLLLLALGTFRLSRLITTDVIAEPLRNLIWKKFPPHTQLGYLFTCNWCMSIWFASLITICYTIVPTATLFCCVILALSAITGVISNKLDN